MRHVLASENAKRERGERVEIIRGEHGDANTGKDETTKEGEYDSVDAARLEKGDLWSGFRYTL